MAGIVERYLGRERHKSDTEIQAEKDIKVENFIDSTGMQRWLAKIVFREQIQLIWESE